ncbi:DUF4236 domain-containing protein [Curtobacterium sp. MCPF17_003]|uniref:DUF4236 domain-containing protein n=1 Tax=Curtobacterium sp. MCPF17_003 TaxID=2175637 RepID=UPI000D9D14C8|nr:DUF4236 domain-containing protein [Curtobacterium sp. MCPF17_003]PYY63600.1 DUF4236 domain-containing protein [Curtobacterium sp. MCPF17_003]
MGLLFRRSKRVGRGVRVNVTQRGVSASARRGPVSISSKGHVTIRLGKGFSFRLF